MLDCSQFYALLARNGIDFYAGVPDSLLKDFCAYVTDNTPKERHIITANEGSAMALASGYHLGTGKVGLVYMQNSGLGNTVNPLTSLVDPEVYSIPMLLVIGWRGEPGKKDEPQHVKIGRVQRAVLDALEIPYAVLPDNLAEAEQVVADAMSRISKNQGPFALLVRAGTFDKYKLKASRTCPYEMSREDAICAVAETLSKDTFVVCTTGMPSRELFEYRVRNQLDRSTDFLTVGSMGHASQIALGIALENSAKRVVCMDGDGAMLMHLGGLSTIGQLAPKNYVHIVLNNGAHDSVGGQPTVGFDVDFCSIAKACGYREATRVSDPVALKQAMAALLQTDGPSLLEIRVKTGNRADIGRPTATPKESKTAFMRRLSEKV